MEIYYDNEGLPGQRIHEGEKFDFGEYEPEFGKEIIVHYRNPHHNIVANVKDLHANTELITFDIPDQIFPMESVRAIIKIRPLPDFMNADKVDFGDIAQVEDHLRALKLLDRELNTSKIHGRIEWQTISVTMDRTTRTYGWRT